MINFWPSQPLEMDPEKSKMFIGNFPDDVMKRATS